MASVSAQESVGRLENDSAHNEATQERPVSSPRAPTFSGDTTTLLGTPEKSSEVDAELKHPMPVRLPTSLLSKSSEAPRSPPSEVPDRARTETPEEDPQQNQDSLASARPVLQSPDETLDENNSNGMGDAEPGELPRKGSFAAPKFVNNDGHPNSYNRRQTPDKLFDGVKNPTPMTSSTPPQMTQMAQMAQMMQMAQMAQLAQMPMNQMGMPFPFQTPMGSWVQVPGPNGQPAYTFQPLIPPNMASKDDSTDDEDEEIEAQQHKTQKPEPALASSNSKPQSERPIPSSDSEIKDTDERRHAEQNANIENSEKHAETSSDSPKSAGDKDPSQVTNTNSNSSSSQSSDKSRQQQQQQKQQYQQFQQQLQQQLQSQQAFVPGMMPGMLPWGANQLPMMGFPGFYGGMFGNGTSQGMNPWSMGMPLHQAPEDEDSVRERLALERRVAKRKIKFGMNGFLSAKNVPPPPPGENSAIGTYTPAQLAQISAQVSAQAPTNENGKPSPHMMSVPPFGAGSMFPPDSKEPPLKKRADTPVDREEAYCALNESYMEFQRRRAAEYAAAGQVTPQLTNMAAEIASVNRSGQYARHMAHRQIEEEYAKQRRDFHDAVEQLKVPAIQDAQGRWVCALCPERSPTYQYYKHLLRHAANHLDIKPFKCPFCDRRFRRSDTARRHQATCQRLMNALSSRVHGGNYPQDDSFEVTGRPVRPVWPKNPPFVTQRASEMRVVGVHEDKSEKNTDDNASADSKEDNTIPPVVMPLAQP